MDVDIVVPVYGQFKLVKTCMDSVLATTTNARLIIVDDCSPASSEEDRLERYANNPRVELVRSPRNLGFLGATKYGARLCSAKALMILNSDTQALHDGWLDIMAHALSKAEVVGPQLVFPPNTDSPLAGTIQHAGVAVSMQGEPYHPFLGWDRTAREVSESKYVNAVTGACMLVKRKVWEELGGWDPEFGRGVYEDVDFCWRAKKGGHRIFYEAGSCLSHQVNGSEDIDDESSLYRNRHENLLYLQGKWAPLESDEDVFFGEGTVERWRKATQKLLEFGEKLAHGDLAGATFLGQQAYDLAPDLPEAVISYSQVCSLNGEHSRAAAYLEQALHLTPTNWKARMHLVREWQACGEYVKAQNAWEALQRASKHHPGVIVE